MIKANELRIGNLIQTKYEGIVQVININSEKFDYVDIRKQTYNGIGRYDIKSCTPIPLTEEWLIKFGFKKPAHSWNGDIFHLTEWDEFPLNWAVAMDKNGAILVLKLKYVHQLQNLYFALTGKELEVKNV
jgi:hypothetical protein